MRVYKILAKVIVFLTAAIALYFVFSVVVFVVVWIVNILSPIPEGVDIYRDNYEIALSNFPKDSVVKPIAFWIAVFAGLIISIFAKFDDNENHQNSRVIYRTFDTSSDEEIDFFENKKSEEPKVDVWEKNENDWFDANLEDYDHEDGFNVEFQEDDDDLD